MHKKGVAALNFSKHIPEDEFKAMVNIALDGLHLPIPLHVTCVPFSLSTPFHIMYLLFRETLNSHIHPFSKGILWSCAVLGRHVFGQSSCKFLKLCGNIFVALGVWWKQPGSILNILVWHCFILFVALCHGGSGVWVLLQAHWGDWVDRERVRSTFKLLDSS